MSAETSIQDTLFGDAPEEVRIMTVRQPWAWAIIYAGKDVENRPKPWTYRGKVIVHAGLTVEQEGIDFLRSIGIEPPAAALTGGHIVGAVQLDGCIAGSTSQWACEGEWHHLLGSPEPATQRVTVRGNLGLLRPPAGWDRAFA